MRTLVGGCRCGHIHYEITEQPWFGFACHCTDCQQLTASAFSLGITVHSTQCEYINSVTATPTEEFFDFIKQHGISFEQAAAARQAAGGDHNRRETPLFGESIARRTLVRSSPLRRVVG